MIERVAYMPLPCSADKQGWGDTNKPKKVVVHAIAQIIDTDLDDYYAWNLLKRDGISAHALIDPDGVMIKCRKESQIAYHAKGFNQDTLGVEFLVKGFYTYESFLERIKTPWLTEEQYEVGQDLVRWWMKNYSIAKIDVVFHSEISPGRKFDPGKGFPNSFRETL